MAATPVFAQYCYPLLIEKLSSDVPSAKADVLKTLVCLVLVDMIIVKSFKCNPVKYM
jgi:hypothetical protein